MTPTRELAAQVAGVATVLAPPNAVRLVTRPTNLMSDGQKDRGEMPGGGRYESDSSPRLFIGSAKAIMQSLYGDGKMPASPTSKPEAMAFLQNVRCVVLDEVDRLLAVSKTRKTSKRKIHEKPAAVVCAAVVRVSLGRAQVVAASATVGRPLRRELARVLGLPAPECPAVVRANASAAAVVVAESSNRAVTIPDTVENYVVQADGSSPGKLLTAAYGVIQELGSTPRRMLLVLTRGFGINTQNVIGALKHFRCRPEPMSLLDALDADGSERMIQVHREVSGAAGVGESAYFDERSAKEESDGYLLVTGEDSVRGLHLDGLDCVIVLGRPNGPDEYTHIAGRTGRAGRPGKVFNVLGDGDEAALLSWERMLNLKFHRFSPRDVASLD